MKRTRSDVLVLKMVSYDSDKFNADVARAYPDATIVNYDFDKIWIVRSPGGDSDIRPFVYPRLTSKGFLGKVRLIFDFFNILMRQSAIMVRLAWRHRPRTIWIEHTYIGVAGGLIRLVGLCRRSVMVAGDWIACPGKGGLLSRIHRFFIFPLLDAAACSLNTTVINNTDRIRDARRKFWRGWTPARRETLYAYQPRLMVKRDDTSERRDLCFIGSLRPDVGLDVVMRAMARQRSQDNIGRLRIIGRKWQDYERLETLSRELGLSHLVDFLGPVPNEHLPGIADACFCGLNLIVAEGTFTSLTIPGKLVTYLQHLLPPVTSRHVGYFAEIIKAHELGIVIDPTPEAFLEALERARRDQRLYRRNILRYIDSFPAVDIRSIIEPGENTFYSQS